MLLLKRRVSTRIVATSQSREAYHTRPAERGGRLFLIIQLLSSPEVIAASANPAAHLYRCAYQQSQSTSETKTKKEVTSAGARTVALPISSAGPEKTSTRGPEPRGRCPSRRQRRRCPVDASLSADAALAPLSRSLTVPHGPQRPLLPTYKRPRSARCASTVPPHQRVSKEPRK